MLFLVILGANAQPFQQSYTNAFTSFSCDHYSIETFNEGGPASYAAAGTFFTSGGQTIMHIFTLDQFGNIVWENYINLGGSDARALDVAVGPDYSVAITGFIDNGSGPELYAAWYDLGGVLINDFTYTGTVNTSGNNIIYSIHHDQFIIGGFETGGSALLIALDGAFNYQWANTFSSACDGFNTSFINEILEVNGQYFITGKLGDPNTAVFGQSQVLVAMVESVSGAIISNYSFVATNSLGGQEAMGVSAHFDREKQQLVLMYNVSISPTVDENRPYLNIYKVSGVNLIYSHGYRIDDTFVSNPSGFTNNPSLTGLKILPNRHNDTYIIFGMIDAYGQGNDRVISVYQELDLNSGSLVASGKTWTQSDIHTGYPAQGGFYSLFNPNILNTNAYSPETTTLSIDQKHFVSILPNPFGSPISYDVFSSTLNTAMASSPCIEEFKPALVDHTYYLDLCLTQTPPAGSTGIPFNTESTTVSTVVNSCPVWMAPLSIADHSSQEDVINKVIFKNNPVEEELLYSITVEGNYDILIMSLDGQVLIANKISSFNDVKKLNVERLASGVYVLVAANKQGEKVQSRFVKK